MMSLLLLILLVVAGIVHGKLVDIRKEVVNVIKQHNNQRSSKHLKAADMLEMNWDDGLASQAGVYAERCRYMYPDAKEFDVGSNLFYQQDFVHGPRSVHRLVNTAMKSWTRSKDYFVYSSNCERACSYVQMIVAQTDKIGCALSTCASLDTGSTKDNFSSIFVCFYSPRQNIRTTFPFKYGYLCSECPSGAICRDGLCTQLGYEAQPSYVQDSPSDRFPAQRQQRSSSTDELTDNDKHYLTVIHNRMRETNSRSSVEWDPYLEQWAGWIVNCNVDYPGPAHSYTNFHRLDQGDQAYTAVYDWVAEGETINVELDHGCRAPNDINRCNHYTNILQPELTSLACAAKDCRDNTRQLNNGSNCRSTNLVLSMGRNTFLSFSMNGDCWTPVGPTVNGYMADGLRRKNAARKGTGHLTKLWLS